MMLYRPYIVFMLIFTWIVSGSIAKEESPLSLASIVRELSTHLMEIHELVQQNHKITQTQKAQLEGQIHKLKQERKALDHAQLELKEKWDASVHQVTVLSAEISSLQEEAAHALAQPKSYKKKSKELVRKLRKEKDRLRKQLDNLKRDFEVQFSKLQASLKREASLREKIKAKNKSFARTQVKLLKVKKELENKIAQIQLLSNNPKAIPKVSAESALIQNQAESNTRLLKEALDGVIKELSEQRELSKEKELQAKRREATLKAQMIIQIKQAEKAMHEKLELQIAEHTETLSELMRLETQLSQMKDSLREAEEQLVASSKARKQEALELKEHKEKLIAADAKIVVLEQDLNTFRLSLKEINDSLGNEELTSLSKMYTESKHRKSEKKRRSHSDSFKKMQLALKLERQARAHVEDKLKKLITQHAKKIKNIKKHANRKIINVGKEVDELRTNISLLEQQIVNLKLAGSKNVRIARSDHKTVQLLQGPIQKPGASQWVIQGNKMLRSGAIDKAEENFNKALELNEDVEAAHVGIASCLYAKNRLIDARNQLSYLYQKDPKHAQAKGIDSLIAWREGSLDNAEIKIKEAIISDPNNADLYNYMAVILHSKSRNEEAVKALDMAIKINPDHLEALINLAILLATSDAPRLNEAKEHYEYALRLGCEKEERLETILYPN